MTALFTDELKNENIETWDAAIHHRFVNELVEGTIPDAVLAGYLIQDYRFLDSFLALLGAAVTTADTLDSRLVFSKYIGEVAGDENTYFVDAFNEFNTPESFRNKIPDTEATREFKNMFLDAAHSGHYAAVLAVLNVTEWIYLTWASNAEGKRPERKVHYQWIDLHDYEGFHKFVGFLRDELDRIGPKDADIAREYFARAVKLERMFFDNSYETPAAI